MSRKSLENTSSSIGLALCAWLLVGVLFGALQRLPLLAEHTALLLFTETALLILPPLCAVLLMKNSFRTPLPLYVRRFECGSAGLFFCGVFASQVLLSALGSAAALLFGAGAAENTLPQGGALLVYCAVRVTLVPLLEELLFRGHIMGRLLACGDGAAVLLSSLLFALAHGSVLQLLPAFCSGIFLAMAALRCGLGCSVLLHAANNVLALLMLFLQHRGAGTLAQTVYIAAALLCLIYVLLKHKSLPALTLRGVSLAPCFTAPLAAAVLLMTAFLL